VVFCRKILEVRSMKENFDNYAMFNFFRRGKLDKIQEVKSVWEKNFDSYAMFISLM
jgi:hypothetical protein